MAASAVYGIVIKQLKKIEKEMKNKVMSTLDAFFTDKIKADDLSKFINDDIKHLKNGYLRFKTLGEKLEDRYDNLLEKDYGGLFIKDRKIKESRKNLAKIQEIRADELDPQIDYMVEKGFHK